MSGHEGEKFRQADLQEFSGSGVRGPALAHKLEEEQAPHFFAGRSSAELANRQGVFGISMAIRSFATPHTPVYSCLSPASRRIHGQDSSRSRAPAVTHNPVVKGAVEQAGHRGGPPRPGLGGSPSQRRPGRPGTISNCPRPDMQGGTSGGEGAPVWGVWRSGTPYDPRRAGGLRRQPR